jgi:predicted TIM-barrel fold metal-dependent hydrolase
MAVSGVAKAVTLPVATKPSQVAAINRSLPFIQAKDIVPFGAMHPQMSDFEEEIAFLKANNIYGVKFHPEFQDFFLDDPAIFPIYEALAASGLIAVFHLGVDPGPFTNNHSFPRLLSKVSRDFPMLRIVGGHFGGYRMWEDAENYLVGLPLYLETSTVSVNLAKADFVRLCRKHGIERILFGSDSPWYDQIQAVRWINECEFSDHEKELVLWKNAESLLGTK